MCIYQYCTYECVHVHISVLYVRVCACAYISIVHVHFYTSFKIIRVKTKTNDEIYNGHILQGHPYKTTKYVHI